MYRTALAISHTMDIEQLLARIMDMIFEWVDADRGCIMLKDAQTGRLVPKVRRHRRGVRVEEKITLSKTILDYVVERNEGVLTSDARDDERWDPAKSIVKLGVREAICVPMKGRYHVVGVVYIDTSVTPQRMLQGQLADGGGKGNQFTEEHLKLMIAIAHQAALAVEDTSYYKALVQAERLAAVGQTIASLSHHIKNILQGVRGGSYLIELGLADHALTGADHALTGADGGANEETERNSSEAARCKAVETIRKGWDIVERNQDRISSLVMDMLTYSKEREPVLEPADLNEVTAEVVGLMQSRAKDQGVDLQWRPAPTMPTLMFDPEALHRAILNVVNNAIEACDQTDSSGGEAKNWVKVSTVHEDGVNVVQVIVEDNGQGIDSDELENIFTVFVSHKGGRGTGLGLPVSRKIMEEHGGQIHVSSTSGEGSRFVLELPATTVHPESPSRQRMTQAFRSEELPAGQSESAQHTDWTVFPGQWWWSARGRCRQSCRREARRAFPGSMRGVAPNCHRGNRFVPHCRQREHRHQRGALAPSLESQTPHALPSGRVFPARSIRSRPIPRRHLRARCGRRGDWSSQRQNRRRGF
jgi:signal transduction histidine kinase